MSVGEVVAALAKCCSDYDDLLFAKSVYSIEVKEDSLEVYFVNGSTKDIRIRSDGTKEYLA